MLLGVSNEMSKKEQEISTKEMVRGFNDCCLEANTVVTGGQTVYNPWPMIGGVATSIVASRNNFIPSDQAQIGDVIVLTKPLGTQIAVNVHQWRKKAKQDPTCNDAKLWKKCVDNNVITSQIADEMMHSAVCSMSKLNKNGARLMLKYGAHACTDVTGFGVLGHAQNLAENQALTDVGIIIDALPCIAGTVDVNNSVFDFRLVSGYSAETSGGLFICLPANQVESFQQEMQELDGHTTDGEPCSWIVGRVVHVDELQQCGDNNNNNNNNDTKTVRAIISDDVKIISV